MRILLNWLVFLSEVLCIVIVIMALIWAGRIIRAVIKRRKALVLIEKTAKDKDYKVVFGNGKYKSLFTPSNTPDIIVETPSGVYLARFVSCLKKMTFIRFVEKEKFIKTKVGGYFLISTRNLLYNAFVKKKAIPSHRFELSEFGARTSHLSPLDTNNGNCKEVVIFNPVPLKVYYQDGNTEKVLVGGETIDNVQYHDVSSFCLKLEQM